MNKNFKYGLKLWSVNTDAYKKEAKRLYKEGLYDFIELYAVPETAQTLKNWQELDIPFIIHAPHYAHGMNLANPDCFENNMKLVKETMLFADSLNAEYIVFHPGVGGKITETARQVNLINDSRILIENKPYKAIPQMSADFCTGSRPQEIRTIMELTKAGFCLDIGHAIAAANSFELDFIEFIHEFTELKPTLYHFSDTDINAEIDSHLNFGAGNLNLEQILRLLPENALITIETNKKSKYNLDDFNQDVYYLNNLLTQYTANCQN